MNIELSGHVCEILNAPPAGLNDDPMVFWFSDHGKAIFKRVGDENVYASFLVNLCGNLSEGCDFRNPLVEFPNPEESKAWPCGCKCVAVLIPDLEADGVDVASTIKGVIEKAVDRMIALGDKDV